MSKRRRALRKLAQPYESCDSGAPRTGRARASAGIVLMWAAYVAAVELIAAFAADVPQAANLTQARQHLLHGFLENANGLPPLARWDSIWFYGIADEGYSGDRPDSRYTAAFLPLYPLLMRWLAALTGIDRFSAGLWISRISLLATLTLLGSSTAEGERSAGNAWLARAALLAFPTAFILVSVYSESLFLALALGAFVFMHRERYACSSACGFLASATRIQGVALTVALAVMAYGSWRRGQRPIRCCMPAVAGLAAYGGMAAYCGAVFGDPLRHFEIRHEVWGQGFALPWITLGTAVDAASRAIRLGGAGSLYTLLQLPCLYLAVFVMVFLAASRPRRWPELTFLAAAVAMSLCGGALGGMPRFTLVLFPVFRVLADVLRQRWLGYTYLIVGSLIQGPLLINYVGFHPPPP